MTETIYSFKDRIRKFIQENCPDHEESAKEFIIFCPFHHNVNTPALSINKTTGLWHCFNEACGKKGNFEQLCQGLGLDGIGIDAPLPPIITDEDLLKQLNSDTKIEEPSWDAALDRITLDYNVKENTQKLDYLVERGFHLSVLNQFEVGYSAVQNRIVIPTRDENFKLVGFIGRAIDEERKPKYKYSDGFPRSNILFNLNNAKAYSEAYITEGSLDAIRIHQAGFPNVVSTLGSNLNGGQIDLLNRYFNEIVILSDNDAAGESLKRAIIDGCPRLNIWVVKYPEGIKDPGDMNDEQIRELILRKINYIDYLFETTFTKEKTKTV
jgi:DNA primase